MTIKMVYPSGLRGGVLESGILLDLGKLYYADQMSECIQMTRFSKSTVIATVYMYKMYSDLLLQEDIFGINFIYHVYINSHFYITF